MKYCNCRRPCSRYPVSPLVFQPRRPIFTHDAVTDTRGVVSKIALDDVVPDRAAARGHRRLRVTARDLLMAFGASLVADVGGLLNRERIGPKGCGTQGCDEAAAKQQNQFEAMRGLHSL